MVTAWVMVLSPLVGDVEPSIAPYVPACTVEVLMDTAGPEVLHGEKPPVSKSPLVSSAAGLYPCESRRHEPLLGQDEP